MGVLLHARQYKNLAALFDLLPICQIVTAMRRAYHQELQGWFHTYYCAIFRAVSIVFARVFAHFVDHYFSSTSIQTVLNRHFPAVSLVVTISTPYF